MIEVEREKRRRVEKGRRGVWARGRGGLRDHVDEKDLDTGCSPGPGLLGILLP